MEEPKCIHEFVEVDGLLLCQKCGAEFDGIVHDAVQKVADKYERAIKEAQQKDWAERLGME